MKKLFTTLVLLAMATSVYAAETTYTEQFVNKWTSPVVQKEKDFRAKQAVAVKSQQAQQDRLESMRKAQQNKFDALKREQELKATAYKKSQEQSQRDFEAAKKARQDALNQTKKDVKSLLTF